MSESDFLEKQLHSWIPRHPSAKVTAGIFSQSQAPAQAALAMKSRAEILRWLTPLAACFLTILAISGGRVHRPTALPETDNATFFATVMLNATQSSNASHQVFSLSKVNENLEWNVWPQVSWRSTNPARADSWCVAMTNR